jgi:pimeloyl-ACP methyl ester carboxylesterase
MSNRIYCISGLAADQRLFDNIMIPGYELVTLNWVPYATQDTMRTYAIKMAQRITEERAIVIGLSFGGMLATELGKLHPDWKIFLVSSAKTRMELGFKGPAPWWMKMISVIPALFFNKPNFILLKAFGARNAAEKALVKDVLKNSDPIFMKWCLQTMSKWDNETIPANITHVHGTADMIIRPEHVHPDHWIADGSHMMIYNKGAEVSKIISDTLKASVTL